MSAYVLHEHFVDPNDRGLDLEVVWNGSLPFVSLVAPRPTKPHPVWPAPILGPIWAPKPEIVH